MHLLLDTHALLWWLSDDPALPQPARRAVADMKNAVYVSAASAWEIATKVRLGKLPAAVDLASDFAGRLERELFRTLPISAEHAIRAGLLAGPHKDPFDRMLAAQALLERLTLVSADKIFDEYAVTRLW